MKALGYDGELKLRERRDPLIGKTVYVARGEYKGYRGFVRTVANDQVHVELEANHRITPVSRRHVTTEAFV